MDGVVASLTKLNRAPMFAALLVGVIGSLEQCAGNCSGHGDCVGGTCLCSLGFFGDACNEKACPLNCNQGCLIDPVGGVRGRQAAKLWRAQKYAKRCKSMQIF